MTTPTPRTDAVRKQGGGAGRFVTLAEELERDLAAAQERNTQLVKALDDMYGTPCEQIRHQQELQAAQEALAQCRALYNETIQRAVAAEARAESYLEILREVDDLIKYQYSGSREAMSYLQHIANRVFAAIDAAREGK